MKEVASVGGLFHFLGFSRRGKSAKGSVKLPALAL
jgi:hypothetical protein